MSSGPITALIPMQRTTNPAADTAKWEYVRKPWVSKRPDVRPKRVSGGWTW